MTMNNCGAGSSRTVSVETMRTSSVHIVSTMIMQEDNVVGNNPGRGKDAKNPAISYQLATTAPV